MKTVLRLLALSLLWLATSFSLAQAPSPEAATPEAQRNYAQGLDDVRKLLAAHQLDAASKRVDELLAQRPKEAQARFFKGMVETERGNAAAATAIFEALTADYPEQPEPYNNLAVLYAGKGDLAGARTALETALKTEPTFALAHENLADIYVRLAAQHYDRAATFDKTNKSAPAKLALARALLNTHSTPPVKP